MFGTTEPPLPAGVVRQMPVVMGRQKRHLEPSLGRVFGANEKPEAKCADRERRDPGCNGVAAPAAQQPDSNRGREPRASNQSYIVPIAT